MKKKASSYADYIEKNKEKLKKDGMSNFDIDQAKKMKPNFGFGKSKKPQHR